MKVNPFDLTVNHREPQVAGRFSEIAPEEETFKTVFKNTTLETHKQICTALLEKIDAQSAALKRSPTPDGIKRYRQLVKEFMKEPLNDAYHLDTKAKWDRMGNRREFVIVKKINQALEELIDSVVGQSQEQLNLIAKLDEIRGLLIDLYC